MICDVLSVIVDMLSECTMTVLVFMLGNGWLTRFMQYDFDDGVDIYAPLFMVIIIVHIIMAALTVIDQDAYHKFHDFSGLLGLGLIVVKLIMAGVFYWFY